MITKKMSDEDLRMRCLQMALDAGRETGDVSSVTVINSAALFFEYARKGAVSGTVHPSGSGVNVAAFVRGAKTK